MSQLSLFTNNDERTNRQLECVQKWVDNKKRGTILAATGFYYLYILFLIIY